MNDTIMTMTGEEQEFLVGLLKTALKETRVEEHRTRAPSYREHILQREEVITSLLQKLGESRCPG